MEFKEALKEILKIKGNSAFEDQSTLKLLEDYGAFDEYPVFRAIMENIIAMKAGEMLQNIFYYSVEDKEEAWNNTKQKVIDGLPYDEVFMNLFFDDLEYAFMGYAYEKGAYDRDINSDVEEMLGQVWTDDKGAKYSVDKKRLINASEIAGSYTVNLETEYIDSYAFQQNSKIERVILPRKLKKIGSHAFQLCPYLNKIEFQDGISEIDECAFGGCALTEVKLPNGLHRVSDALFSTCTNLLYVHISKSVTSIGAHAFSDCHSLQYMVIPDNVSTIGNLAFRWCKSLYYVVLPAKLTSVGDNIFDNCKSLRYIGIPKGTKSKFTLLMPQYANLFVEFEQTQSNEKMKIIKNETLSFYQGKTNVIHYVMDNGQESYLSQSRSFDDEANAKGACKLNTVENEKKHVLFLFNSNNKEVGRYYLGKKLQGQTPDQIIGQIDRLCFFEAWNPETKSWVPCVGISADNPPKDIASKAISISNNQTNKMEQGSYKHDSNIGNSIGSQLYTHLGKTLNTNVNPTRHLLLLQNLLNNSLFTFKHPFDKSELPSFMWNKEGLSLGYDSVLPYAIPFLWIRTLAKRDVEKFDGVIDLLHKEFGVEVSEKIDVANIVQGIKQYGFIEFKPNFDVQVNKLLLSKFYGDCLCLENFILFFGSNIDMNDLLPSQSKDVYLSAASLSLNKIICEMVDDFRQGNIESN